MKKKRGGVKKAPAVDLTIVTWPSSRSFPSVSFFFALSTSSKLAPFWTFSSSLAFSKFIVACADGSLPWLSPAETRQERREAHLFLVQETERPTHLVVGVLLVFVLTAPADADTVQFAFTFALIILPL